MTIVSVNWIYDVFVFKLHLVSTWYRSTMEVGPPESNLSSFQPLVGYAYY